jgi:hypothetical protein
MINKQSDAGMMLRPRRCKSLPPKSMLNFRSLLSLTPRAAAEDKSPLRLKKPFKPMNKSEKKKPIKGTSKRLILPKEPSR